MSDEEIIACCADYGMPLRSVRRNGRLLQLVCDDEHTLDPTNWAELAEVIRGRDATIRWVTLHIGERDD